MNQLKRLELDMRMLIFGEIELNCHARALIPPKNDNKALQRKLFLVKSDGFWERFLSKVVERGFSVQR